MQWAIINDDEYTGVTIHYMDNGVDTGDVIAQIKVKIDNTDTWVDLKDKLVIASDKILKETLAKILQGVNKREKQDERLSLSNFRLDTKYPRIDFELMNDKEIYNLIRAQVYPLKGAFIQDGKKRVYFNKKVSLEDIKKLRKNYAK